MRAVLIEAKDIPAQVAEADEATLLDGEVELDVLHSSYNYKDGLALAGVAGVVRSGPLIPGIDLVGEVTASSSQRWAPGDIVVLNGDGLGETLHGGFSTRARVRPDALVRLPAAISPQRAAAIGTAGFTAMIAVLKLADAGITPTCGDDVLVTGAAGGVGSVAISLLAWRGYRVVASGGRIDDQRAYPEGLGAATLIDRNQLSESPCRPSAGPVPSTRSAAPRWPTSSPRRTTAERSPAAAWPRGTTCPRP